MRSKTVFIKTIALAGSLIMPLAVAVPPAFAAGSGMASIDTDHDKKISQDEARAAAEKKFDSLDKQHTGKLEEKQIPPMEASIREMARHARHHVIDKDEYMAGVIAAFKEADKKGAGVLDEQALQTKAGKHFLSLVE